MTFDQMAGCTEDERLAQAGRPATGPRFFNISLKKSSFRFSRYLRLKIGTGPIQSKAALVDKGIPLATSAHEKPP
jgi:hypothetical protein